MPNEERILEHLIRGSEDLIRDIEIRGAPSADEPDIPPPMASQEKSEEPSSTDGTAVIEVSKDGMLAHATLYPPTGNGGPLTIDVMREAIKGKGVNTGIDWEAIKGSVLTCNEERIVVSEVVVARGRRPRDEIPPYLVLSEVLAEKPKKEQPEAARVNFRELSLFTLVKKGDVLATLEPKQDGAMGTTVRGTGVAFHKEPVPYPKPGRNTQWESGTVIAQCDGKFHPTPDSFWVDEVLEVAGDLDLRTGNIDFPGDVVIKGELRDGFVVKAGKSVLCIGAIGAARVECKEDLVTQSGVLGKETAVLSVGGAMEAKFIEGCSLSATGPVRVRTSVMNSMINTKDRLEMGDRGIIIGGVIRAANGVSAAQIGSERGPRTEIHCGIDFTVERKLIWIRDKNIALAFKLKEIETRMKANPGTRAVLAPLRDRIRTALHQLNESARKLVTTLDRNESATVSVRGNVFPGTYIEICHISHFVTKPRRMVTFRLDKASGKIIETSWVAQSGGR
ncbi:MAG: FapA family protein [Spirochaetia bacterium]|jgi:uncharacterized protein (DUF342 family)